MIESKHTHNQVQLYLLRGNGFCFTFDYMSNAHASGFMPMASASSIFWCYFFYHTTKSVSFCNYKRLFKLLFSSAHT